MCIRDVRTYRCPYKGEGWVVHRRKYNILCASLTVCPKTLWERREKDYGFACPACAGGSEVVQHHEPGHVQITGGDYDALNTPTGNLIDLYIGQWARFLNLVAFAGEAGSLTSAATNGRSESLEELKGYWTQMQEEDLCKEHSHEDVRCKCDAQIDRDEMFRYNPASAFRYNINERIRMQLMHDERFRRPEFETWTHAAARLLRSRHNGTLFREGRVRWPPRTTNELLAASVEFDTARKQAQKEAVAKARAAYPGVVQNTQPFWRELGICRMLADFMVEDVGISHIRLGHILRHLVRGVCGLEYCHPSLQRLFDQVNTNQKLDLIRQMQSRTMRWVKSCQSWWHADNHKVLKIEAFFRGTTSVLSKDEFDALDECDRVCPLCCEHYYDAPDQRDEPRSPPGQAVAIEPTILGEGDRFVKDKRYYAPFFPKDSRFTTGEIPVRITRCRHVFGQRCLFNSWATKLPRGPWKCPVCRDYHELEDRGAFMPVYLGWKIESMEDEVDEGLVDDPMD